jgi:hypothetical protein
MNGREEEKAGSLNNSQLRWMEVPGIASQLPAAVPPAPEL